MQAMIEFFNPSLLSPPSSPLPLLPSLPHSSPPLLLPPSPPLPLHLPMHTPLDRISWLSYQRWASTCWSGGHTSLHCVAERHRQILQWRTADLQWRELDGGDGRLMVHSEVRILQLVAFLLHFNDSTTVVGQTWYSSQPPTRGGQDHC